MSTVKLQDATKAALHFLKEAYSGKEISDILLEEVELSDDGSRWFITLGFNRLVEIPDAQFPFMGQAKLKREFKTITVDSSTGVAVGMKMKGSTPVVE